MLVLHLLDWEGLRDDHLLVLLELVQDVLGILFGDQLAWNQDFLQSLEIPLNWKKRVQVLPQIVRQDDHRGSRILGHSNLGREAALSPLYEEDHRVIALVFLLKLL